MSANRKIQSDIDKVLKAMNSGLSEFEDIREKLDETTDQHQREKVEADLKKCLKKLQKCRDQIKGWIPTEVKSKGILEEAKRKIELKMEEFKEIERQSKIKPYSIVGLSRVSEDEESTDDEAESDVDETWIGQAISTLKEQIQTLKAEKEPTGKKKKQSQSKKQQIQKHIDLNQKHVDNLKILSDALRWEIITEDDVCSPSGQDATNG